MNQGLPHIDKSKLPTLKDMNTARTTPRQEAFGNIFKASNTTTNRSVNKINLERTTAEKLRAEVHNPELNKSSVLVNIRPDHQNETPANKLHIKKESTQHINHHTSVSWEAAASLADPYLKTIHERS